MRTYFVYILPSDRGTLYTGVTNNIWERVLTYKKRILPGFTNKYNVTRLVYYEETNYILATLNHEKQIKGWRRRNKKLSLIESLNPQWADLSEDWYSKEDLLK